MNRNRAKKKVTEEEPINVSDDELSVQSDETDGDASPRREREEKVVDLTQDDEAEGFGNLVSASERFRVNAKAILLTYAQCGKLDAKELYTVMNTRWPVKGYLIGREKHADGSPHMHAYFEFVNKLDVKNATAFDVKTNDLEGKPVTLHPNVRTVKHGKREAVMHYCMKEGNFIQEKLDIFPTSRNFMRKKIDLDQWIRYKQHGRADEVKWPIKLLDGTLVNKPKSLHEKKRHWFIWGKPDIGKTTWVQTQFAGQKAFCRAPDGDAPFDDYDGEEVIVYDDVNIESLRAELIAASNVYQINTKVPGRTRYTTRYWPLNQVRTIIILGNDKPSFSNDGWWESRFNMLDLTEWEPLERLCAPMVGEFSPLVPQEWQATVDPDYEPATPTSPSIITAAQVLSLQLDKEVEEAKANREKAKAARMQLVKERTDRLMKALKHHPKSVAPEDDFLNDEPEDPYN